MCAAKGARCSASVHTYRRKALDVASVMADELATRVALYFAVEYGPGRTRA